MVKKIIGYILFGLGIIGAALSYNPIRTAIGITNIPSVLLTSDGLYLLIVSAIILLIGAYLAFKGSGGKQAAEVPIFKGKDIVGYRRMK